ncbi:radical SAM protein [Streptomyces sp. SYSU K217416]
MTTTPHVVQSSAIGSPAYTETMSCTPQSARKARVLVSLALSAWDLDALVDAGKLIVSEFVGNAVEHTDCNSLRVTVTRLAPDRVRIAVIDKSSRKLALREAADDDEGGRGLAIVAAVAEDTGTDNFSWGKRVWAELRLLGDEPSSALPVQSAPAEPGTPDAHARASTTGHLSSPASRPELRTRGDLMYELIVAPFLDDYLILRPGHAKGLKVPGHRYLELKQAATVGAVVPGWLCGPVFKQWGIDPTGRPVTDVLLIRAQSPYKYGRASYELNMGCNWACKHCYLGLKEFAGLDWPERVRLLHILRDAGVLWLQITGGEPTIDRHFAAVYSLAYDLGMMVEVLTNGSRLHSPLILKLLTERRPYRLTLSVYGATEETYDELTQRNGAWKSFQRGVEAASAANLPVEFSIIVTRDNEHEVEAMYDLAESFGARAREYNNMTPTYFGSGETLSSQATTRHRERKIFTGCDAGHTSLHVDPHGMASVCKIARDHPIPLIEEGITGLSRLGGIADQALLRQGGCSGCMLSSTCSTCMPLAQRYREAKAPLRSYCQHTESGRR